MMHSWLISIHLTELLTLPVVFINYFKKYCKNLLEILQAYSFSYIQRAALESFLSEL